MPYDILVPAKMIIGPGSLAKMGESVAALGAKALVVTGRRALRTTGTTHQILQYLNIAGVETVAFEQVEPEPSCETCDFIRDILRSKRCNVVVGAGGGSALDAAKAAAGLAGEDARTIEFWKGDAHVTRRGIPFVAVPTTAGSGAEASRNAVITNAAVPAKNSIRDDSFVARVVIVDPYLTLTVPPRLTACSGMDALVQSIEAFTSRHASPMTDLWAFEAVLRLKDSVLAAFRSGADLFARTDAAVGSLLSGLALSNARLGLAHGLAHPLGARYKIPHGIVCAALMPHVMRFNRENCREKYAKLDAALGGDAVAFLENLSRQLDLPGDLKQFNIKPTDIPLLVEESLPSGSLKANPRTATPEACTQILRDVI